MYFSYKELVKGYKKGDLLPKNNRQFENAVDNKNAWYLYYRQYFLTLIVNLFEWKNLPDGIDPLYLEKNLNEDGYIAFLYDDEKGLLVQTGTTTNDIDLYGKPTGFTVVSPSSHLLKRTSYKLNNYIDDLDKENATIISNDSYNNSSMYWVDLFSVKLANIENTIEIARNQAKIPYVIITNEENKVAVKNLYQQIDEGRPVIYLKESKTKDGLPDGSLLDKVQLLNNGTPNSTILRDLYEEKTRVFNQFLNFIGITTNNNDKKERLISAEITADDGLIATTLENKLKARKKAIDLINRCYNLDIEVNISPSIEAHNLQMLDEEIDLLDNDLEDIDITDGNKEIEDTNEIRKENNE